MVALVILNHKIQVVVERVHLTIKDIINSRIKQQGGRIASHLQTTVRAYNQSDHFTLKDTPNNAIAKCRSTTPMETVLAVKTYWELQKKAADESIKQHAKRISQRVFIEPGDYSFIKGVTPTSRILGENWYPLVKIVERAANSTCKVECIPPWDEHPIGYTPARSYRVSLLKNIDGHVRNKLIGEHREQEQQPTSE